MDWEQTFQPSPPANAIKIFRQAGLCTNCLELLPPAWIYDGKSARLIRHGQKRSRRDLEESSKEGCGFCDSLLNILNQQHNLSLNEDLYLTTGKILGQVSIYEDASNVFNFLYDIMIDLGDKNQTGFVGAHSLSRESLAFVFRMFNQCGKRHDVCKKIEESPLPKRVLYVGSKSMNTIKLIERPRDRAHYVCLSHCWGNTESITTTSQNISDHKIGIPWSNLPRVYRDAITFCRELEVQYIWIDSLCIKQDDVDDWAEESSKMASIYENSYLTLAATSAQNHDDACASQLAPIHHVKEVGRLRLKDSSMSFPVLLRRPLFHPHREETTSADVQVGIDSLKDAGEQHRTAYPLLSRAWVYQERLLPPRVLHFLPNELLWECKSGIECECQSITAMTEMSESFIERKNFKTLGRRGMSLQHCSGCQKLAIWHSILESYTELELTVSTDRLPAISGIARKLQEDQGDRYLAGLWESTLPDALFWSRDVSNRVMSDILPRPEPPAAPTWSWASISGARLRKYGLLYCRTCRNGGSQAIPIIRVERVDVQPATVNPYGAVKANATLVISGPIRSGFLRVSQGGPVFVISKNATEIKFEPDYDFEHPGQYYVSQGSELVCLYRNCLLHAGEKNYLDCVIFRGIAGGRYERIGYVPLHTVESQECANFQMSTLTLV